VTNLWYEITASVPSAETEAVADAMRAIAPGGVTVEEPIDILGPEMGFRVRKGEPNLVRAWLPASELGAILVSNLREAMERWPQVELTAKPIYEQDWAVNWREFFGVVETGGRIVVVPTWIEHEDRGSGQLIIRLDPGRAFGTGHLESTRLCLVALERHVRPGDAVFDVGTGSGILSIGAKLLGAGDVDAVDIDPTAAEVARENAAVNGVSVNITAGAIDPASVTRTYDIVVANISAAANISLAPAFAEAARDGGVLVLSGLLDENVEEVSAAMAPWFEQRHLEVDRDWALVEFVRKAR
jgi:ribosomal protein L11 methyltransferase